jgi:hypothetical protein
MSKSNTTENDFMKAVFLGVDPAWRDASGQPNVYVALHTADPTEGGTQTTSECSYDSYARVAVARSAAGWTVSGNSATNFAKVEFLTCSGGTSTARYFSIGLGDTGVAGQILYSGQLNDELAISNLVQPIFNATSLTITED